MVTFMSICITSCMIVVCIILIRVVFRTPFTQHLFESFSSTSTQSLMNSSTICPDGSKFFMFKGQPYCCSGKIDSNANIVQKSCRPIGNRDEELTFCTLGSISNSSIPNCVDHRTKNMARETATVCPPNTTLVKNATQSFCCTGRVNAEMTECDNPYCKVINSDNFFTDPNSCQFKKAQADPKSKCPSGFTQFTTSGIGNLSDIYLFGCTDNNKICYTDNTIQQLQGLHYNVSGLQSCSS